jgi:hypothetical protein
MFIFSLLSLFYWRKLRNPFLPSHYIPELGAVYHSDGLLHLFNLVFLCHFFSNVFYQSFNHFLPHSKVRCFADRRFTLHFFFWLTYILVSADISSDEVELKHHKKFVCRNRHLSVSRWYITRWGTKWYHTEIIVILVPESPIFIIIAFVVVTTTTCIYTCLTVIRITETVTQNRPTYFGIRPNTIKYISVWTLSSLNEFESSRNCWRMLFDARSLVDATETYREEYLQTLR